MWFDGVRQPNTLYVANTSRGKDSTAMLRAIQLMGWPLDAICAIDIWATDTIPAELPPMVAFKDEYDEKVLEWFGIPVTRLCATKRERERECRLSYADMFHRKLERGKHTGTIKGFPMQNGSWCKHLKTDKVDLRSGVLSQDISPRERAADIRIPDAEGQLVYEPQNSSIKGFPWRKGAWCQDRLKGNILDRVFRYAPERGAKNKYRSLHRHCCR